MTSVVSDSTSRPRSIDISSLSPEILLSIFLNLSSGEVVVFRRICKQWLDVIDTNKPLWRNLEWIEKSVESVEKAVELFDEKSASTLEVVSIEEDGALNTEDLQEVVPVISQSGANLKSLSVLTFKPSLVIGQLLDLANSSPNLEKLVLWHSHKGYKQFLPLIHLVLNRKRAGTGSSASSLKVLWLFSTSTESTKQLLQLPTQSVQSLMSFALYGTGYFQKFRPFLSKFSDTLVHLRLTTIDGGSRIDQPLFCPNLRILEGNFEPGVSLYFDCPSLKHLILLFGSRTRLHGIPSLVEQLWVKSDGHDFPVELWLPLLSSCPTLMVLRLENDSKWELDFELDLLLQTLEQRQEIVGRGEKIQGLHVLPLQKWILPLNVLSRYQLERARKLVREVVDIQDYPNFIDLEY